MRYKIMYKLISPLCTLLAMCCLMLLVACDAGRAPLSITYPSPGEVVEIVPGSSGIGKPQGAIEIRYTLGREGPVTATLQGPTDAVLLSESQKAGEHILRFNGVIAASAKEVYASPNDPTSIYRVVRRVVSGGDYTLTIATGDTQQSVALKVSGPDTQPPVLDHLVLHPDTISPNSDAVDDVGEVTFRTDQTATLLVELSAPNGASMEMLAATKRGPGEQNAVISGQTTLGEVLPDGIYTVTVRAQDMVGNMVEAARPLKIESGGEPEIAITRVDVSPQQIILGQAISVSITVKNIGNVPLRTQGPDPGYTYSTNDTYSSIEGNKWTDKAGLWRVGVDWDGNSGGGGAYRYPFRWGLGKTLMPGEEVTTGGKIVILKQERKMWFYAGVLQEGIRIVLDRLGRTPIGIDF
jgi:hypothetical protein